MNKTKKLTTGAMLLAIVGALMLIDRQFSYMLETFIITAAPVMIIIYSAMYDIKDGLILAFCILVLTFILGNPTYGFIYMPINVIVGVGYSFGLKKHFAKNKLLVLAAVLFIIGEVTATFIIQPILGISIADQVKTMQEIYGEVLSASGMSDINPFASIGVNLTSIILICLVISTLFIGVMEGLIIHILSNFLLVRFKIMTIEKGAIFPFNLHPVVAYICMAGAFGFYATNLTDNETIKLILITCSLIGSMVLVYYGYIYSIIFLRLITGKKTTGLIVIAGIFLLFPISVLVLMFIGFLYGAGPLKKVLIDKGFKQ